MKTWTKLLMVGGLLAGMSMLPSAASAATTSSGTLTVNASVTPSISMVFNSDSSGVALSSGAGSNAATLAFGNVVAYGSEPANVTESNVTSSDYTVSTNVDVNVSEANSISANYYLTAQLGSADSTNSWAVDGTAISNSAATDVGSSTASYGSNVSHSVSITIPISEASGSISNTINFVATAN